MGYFAGLDVSLEETTVCVVDDAGQRLTRNAFGMRVSVTSSGCDPSRSGGGLPKHENAEGVA